MYYCQLIASLSIFYSSLSYTYQSSFLYFVTYSLDDPSNFEYSPVEAFNPFKKGSFARMLIDSSGRVWPTEPKQYIYRIAENANQVNQRVGVTQHSLLISLTPTSRRAFRILTDGRESSCLDHQNSQADNEEGLYDVDERRHGGGVEK